MTKAPSRSDAPRVPPTPLKRRRRGSERPPPALWAPRGASGKAPCLYRPEGQAHRAAPGQPRPANAHFPLHRAPARPRLGDAALRPWKTPLKPRPHQVPTSDSLRVDKIPPPGPRRSTIGWHPGTQGRGGGSCCARAMALDGAFGRRFASAAKRATRESFPEEGYSLMFDLDLFKSNQQKRRF